MTKDEALKQALEALKLIDDAMPFPVAKLAMKNLRERLAQPEQEPAGYVAENGVVDWNVCAPPIMTDLYTFPPPQRKPLTNGEIHTAYITATNQTLRAQDERLALAFARAIEAAHGIKAYT